MSTDYERLLDRAFGQLSHAERKADIKFRDDIYSLVNSMAERIKELEAELAKPKLTVSVYPDFVPDAKWAKDKQHQPATDGE